MNIDLELCGLLCNRNAKRLIYVILHRTRKSVINVELLVLLLLDLLLVVLDILVLVLLSWWLLAPLLLSLGQQNKKLLLAHNGGNTASFFRGLLISGLPLNLLLQLPGWLELNLSIHQAWGDPEAEIRLSLESYCYRFQVILNRYQFFLSPYLYGFDSPCLPLLGLSLSVLKPPLVFGLTVFITAFGPGPAIKVRLGHNTFIQGIQRKGVAQAYREQRCSILGVPQGRYSFGTSYRLRGCAIRSCWFTCKGRWCRLQVGYSGY